MARRCDQPATYAGLLRTAKTLVALSKKDHQAWQDDINYGKNTCGSACVNQSCKHTFAIGAHAVRVWCECVHAKGGCGAGSVFACERG